MNGKFLIIAGGECRCDLMLDEIGREHLASVSDGAFIIAADSGYDTAMKLSLTPDLLVGDMDSISEVPTGLESHRVKAEKDDTDTMLAISMAQDRGAESICIIGGGGGRADHWLSNVFMLEQLCDRGITAELWDGLNRIRVIRNGEAVVPNIGGYFGVLALEDSKVILSGCKYPAEGAELKRTAPYAVSNEVTSESAAVSAEGKVIITESRRP